MEWAECTIRSRIASATVGSPTMSYQLDDGYCEVIMNSASPFIRMELVKRADLVAALRLPNNTFFDNAGTDVGSDLIILQKHM